MAEYPVTVNGTELIIEPEIRFPRIFPMNVVDLYWALSKAGWYCEWAVPDRIFVTLYGTRAWPATGTRFAGRKTGRYVLMTSLYRR